MELPVYTKEGNEAGRSIQVSDAIFAVEPNEHAVYLAVNAQLTNLRQGTRATKTRSEVSGGGKKPWKQKGRGTARSGSSRSPIWRGGGTTHGPKPQDFDFKLPVKVKRLARKSVLSSKAKDAEIKIVEDFNLELAKTKEVSIVLKSFGLTGNKTLLLLPEYDEKFWVASRNIKNLKVHIAQDASTYDLLHCQTLLIMESAIKKLEGAFKL
jgi:large subunit ribosomal protein L4